MKPDSSPPQDRGLPGRQTQLELRSVGLQFGTHVVFKNLNFQIQAGERVALIGPSGQGKSSLVKLLAGLIVPDEGALLVEGQNFHELPAFRQQQLRVRMGMLFQRNALFDSMRNLENVCFPLRESRQSSPAEKKALGSGGTNESLILKAKSALESVGLAHAADLFPDEISGGMQKRLGIARAIVLDPEIIFYDDPTAGLDPITSRKIVELIVQLQQQKNSTMLAITNDMNRARQLGTRIVMVIDQNLIEVGGPDEMRQHSDPRVRQFVLGQTQGPLLGLQ